MNRIPSPAEPLMIQRRRWTAMLALPFAVFVAAGGLLFAIVGYTSVDGGLGVAFALLGGVCFLGSASVAWHSWQGVAHREPVLIVDAEGISDDFHLHMFVPWSDIASATVDYGEGHSLVMTLCEGASLPSGKVVQRSFTRMAKRAFTGGDVVIPLGSLSVDYRKLKRSLQYHIARVARG